MLFLLALTAIAVPNRGATCEGPLELGLDEPRPVLSGEVQTWDFVDGDFRLHWTDVGADAPAVNVDGEPLLLPMVEAALARVRNMATLDDWRPLALDDGTGGTPGIDIYIVDIDSNGYANPITPAAGQLGASCFVRIDPGISGYGSEIATSIVLHELTHCLQYRYTVEADAWLYEASATFEQYRASGETPELAVPLGVLWAQRLSQPDRPLYDTGDRFEYAGFIWFKFMEEGMFVGPAQVWTHLEAQPGWREGLETAVGEGTLGDAFARFSLYNVFSCARGARGGYDTTSNAHCTAGGAAVPLVDLQLDGLRQAEIEVEGLAPWTSTSFFVPSVTDLQDGEFVESLAMTCSVRSGAISATAADVASGFDHAAGHGSEGEVFTAQILARGAPVPAGTITLASVGEEPADVRCQVQWVMFQGCSCQSSPSSSWLWGLALIPWFIRRRRS